MTEARAVPTSRWIGWLIAVLVFGTVVVASVADPPPAARFTGTVPADGASLAAPPERFELVFDGAVQARSFHVTVATEAGAPVATDPPRVDGERVVLTVAGLGAGRYVAAYHVLLGDGEQVAGSSRFAVATGGGPAEPVAAGPAGGHAGHGVDDPFSLGLLLLDLVLAAVLVTVMLLRRRRRA